MTETKRKLVSILTGTYNRQEQVNRCIEQVRGQTYKEIEHCIVSDGPDVLLRAWHKNGWPYAENTENARTIKFVETGRQWSHFLANSISAVPFQVAQWLASGDYIMWFADDEEISEDHVEKLVNLLEREDVDFVYSKSEIWFNPLVCGTRPNTVIGKSVPARGNITQALFRVELLDYCGFRTDVGSGTDWDQVSTWINSGASWAFLDEVTHTHKVDKWGDLGTSYLKQPLRGQINGFRRPT